MVRMFGMMPSSEIKKQKTFKVGVMKLGAVVQAGEKGWTILYADSSSEYNDVVDSTEGNFNAALTVLKNRFVEVDEIKN